MRAQPFSTDTEQDKSLPGVVLKYHATHVLHRSNSYTTTHIQPTNNNLRSFTLVPV